MSSVTTLRGGRYALMGVLGEGAQGTTYDARDQGAGGRPVAIKRFDVRGARSWKDVELAEREARVLATFDHPLVPRYVDHFEEDGALYLVMEKIEGENLDTILRRQGCLSDHEVRRFLACADRALTYLHGRSSPVVHRDIKPRNVIRRPDGSYVLVDFGAVSELLRRRGGSTVAGTVGYMAPEQLHGQALAQTDVYAVGATALSALAGLEGEHLPRRGFGIDVRGALSSRGIAASPSLVGALERMLEPDPGLRPASVGAALEASSGTALSPPAAGTQAEEYATAKSIRNLLWVMWGLSWMMVPLIFGKFLRDPELIPLIQFGSMAGLIMLGWHRSALIRMGMRLVMPRRTGDTFVETRAARGPRVVTSVGDRVRVHASELQPGETLGDTDVGYVAARRASRA